MVSWETIKTGINGVVPQLDACAQITRDALLLTGVNCLTDKRREIFHCVQAGGSTALFHRITMVTLHQLCNTMSPIHIVCIHIHVDSDH